MFERPPIAHFVVNRTARSITFLPLAVALEIGRKRPSPARQIPRTRMRNLVLPVLSALLAGAAFAQTDPRLTSRDEWFAKEQPLTAEAPTQQADFGDSTDKGINDQFNRFGYHILKMNPLYLQRRGINSNIAVFAQYPQDARRYKVTGAYKIPEWYIHSPILQSDSELAFRLFFSEQERMAGFSRNVSQEGGTSYKEVGVSVGYKETHESGQTELNSNEQTAVFGEKVVQKYWLTLDKRRVALNAPFRAAVVKLAGENFDDQTLVHRFFDNYGTHFPLGVLYGGRCFHEEYVSRGTVMKGLTQALSKETTVGIKGKVVEVALSAGYGTQNAAKATTVNELRNLKVRTIGGTGTTFDSFDVTSANDAVPVSLALRPIHELLRPEFFPEINPATLGRLRDSLNNRLVTLMSREADLRPAIDVLEFSVIEIGVRHTGSAGNLPFSGSLTWGMGHAKEISGGYPRGIGDDFGNIQFSDPPFAHSGPGSKLPVAAGRARRLIVAPRNTGANFGAVKLSPVKEDPSLHWNWEQGLLLYDKTPPEVLFNFFFQGWEVGAGGARTKFQRSDTWAGPISQDVLFKYNNDLIWEHPIFSPTGTQYTFKFRARRLGDTMGAMTAFPFLNSVAQAKK